MKPTILMAFFALSLHVAASDAPAPVGDHPESLGFESPEGTGGVKAGAEYGHTDDLGYAAVDEFKLGHADVHATILHLLGLDCKKLTFEYEGRDESLTGVIPARVINEILI